MSPSQRTRSGVGVSAGSPFGGATANESTETYCECNTGTQNIWESNFEEVGETPACVIIKNLYYASLKLNLSLRLKSKTNCSLEALS